MAAPLVGNDNSSSSSSVPPSPSFVTCMQRGWKRACSLLGALLAAAVLIMVVSFLVLVVVGSVIDAKHIPLALQIILTTISLAASTVALAWTLAGCACLRPAVVWGRRGIIKAVQQSFALAAGQQWYILCLQLTIALAEAVVVVTLWTVLGDFSLMVLLGSVESTLAVVALVGGPATVLFLLLSPALSLVLDTILYINLRTCQGNYTREDLLADLQQTTGDVDVDDDNQQEGNELQAPLLANDNLVAGEDNGGMGEQVVPDDNNNDTPDAEMV